MHTTIAEKTVRVDMSTRAQKALGKQESPLHVEMELLFSCLIRKRVHFGVRPTNGTFSSDELPNLHIAFRPVMARSCSLNEMKRDLEVTDFPIVNAAAFVPKWLSIDYQGDQWHGEFGY